VLEKNSVLLNNHYDVIWPTVYIDEQHVGSMRMDDIILDICLKLENPPTGCVSLLNEKSPTSAILPTAQEQEVRTGMSSGSIAWIVIGVCAVTLAIVFFFYRRYLRTRISKEMSQKVGEAVQQYMTFYQAEK
jgi:hypothetical protein